MFARRWILKRSRSAIKTRPQSRRISQEGTFLWADVASQVILGYEGMAAFRTNHLSQAEGSGLIRIRRAVRSKLTHLGCRKVNRPQNADDRAHSCTCIFPGLAEQKHNKDASTNRVERDRTLAQCFFSVGVRPDNNASQTTGRGDAYKIKAWKLLPWRGVFSASVFVLTTTQAKQLGRGTRIKSKCARTFLYSWAWQKKSTAQMRAPARWKEIAPWRGVFFSFGVRPDNNASQTAGRGDEHKIKVCKDLLVPLGLAKQKHSKDANTNGVERDRTLARCFFSVGVRPDNNASQTAGRGDARKIKVCKDLLVLLGLAKEKHNTDANTSRVERDRTLARCFFQFRCSS